MLTQENLGKIILAGGMLGIATGCGGGLNSTFPPLPPVTDYFALAHTLNGFGGSGVSLHYTTPNVPFCWGQADCVSGSINSGGGSIISTGLSSPYGMGALHVDPYAETTKFFINDRGNNRVLIFNQVPIDNTAVPDVVIGQNDFVSGGANTGGSVRCDRSEHQQPRLRLHKRNDVHRRPRKQSRFGLQQSPYSLDNSSGLCLRPKLHDYQWIWQHRHNHERTQRCSLHQRHALCCRKNE